MYGTSVGQASSSPLEVVVLWVEVDEDGAVVPWVVVVSGGGLEEFGGCVVVVSGGGLDELGGCVVVEDCSVLGLGDEAGGVPVTDSHPGTSSQWSQASFWELKQSPAGHRIKPGRPASQM